MTNFGHTGKFSIFIAFLKAIFGAVLQQLNGALSEQRGWLELQQVRHCRETSCTGTTRLVWFIWVTSPVNYMGESVSLFLSYLPCFSWGVSLGMFCFIAWKEQERPLCLSDFAVWSCSLGQCPDPSAFRGVKFNQRTQNPWISVSVVTSLLNGTHLNSIESS